MRIAYVNKNFTTKSEEIINQANLIIDEYEAAGFKLTLRQLYYQFVARDLIENTQSAYKRLGSIINDARLAGLISWTAIEDRTRNLKSLPHWANPKELIHDAANQYRLDKWRNQNYRPEVWIEKEALIGVIAGVCDELDVPYFACRGYNSQSEAWGAAMRFNEYAKMGQAPIVLYLGDHDPSGIDMTRDNRDRLKLLAGEPIQVVRLALNMDQIETQNPPPNPTKLTDSRASEYIEKYGNNSWELDALDPAYIANLAREAVLTFRDEDKWNGLIDEEKSNRDQLLKLATSMA